MRVVRLVEVGSISLLKTLTTNGVGIIVLENATSGVQKVVDALLSADVGDVQATNHVSANSLSLVILTPVHIRTTGHTSSIKNVGGVKFLNLSLNTLSVVSTRLSEVKCLALSGKKLNQLATNPAVLSEQQIHVLISRHFYEESTLICVRESKDRTIERTSDILFIHDMCHITYKY